MGSVDEPCCSMRLQSQGLGVSCRCMAVDDRVNAEFADRAESLKDHTALAQEVGNPDLLFRSRLRLMGFTQAHVGPGSS